MSRETVTTEQVTEKIRCDFCKECAHAKACANRCGKDVCHPCGETDPHDYGDYVDRYCPRCWELPERTSLFAYYAHSKERRDGLETQWRKAGKS